MMVPVQRPLLDFGVVFPSVTRSNANTVASSFADVLRLVDVYDTS